MAEIEALPPGPQRDAALAKFITDYKTQQAGAMADRSFGEEQAMSPMAQGTQTGGKYGTFVAASPLEHLATGLRQYQGMKDVQGSREKLDAIAQKKQDALNMMMQSMLRQGGGGGMGGGGMGGGGGMRGAM